MGLFNKWGYLPGAIGLLVAVMVLLSLDVI
jgi:hypothetical protein